MEMLKILVKTPASCAMQSFRTEMYGLTGKSVDSKPLFMLELALCIPLPKSNGDVLCESG